MELTLPMLLRRYCSRNNGRREAGLVRRSVLLEVDHRLHAERGEIVIVAPFRLRPAVVVVVHFAEVVDANVCEHGRGRRRNRRRRGFRERRSCERDSAEKNAESSDRETMTHGLLPSSFEAVFRFYRSNVRISTSAAGEKPVR